MKKKLTILKSLIDPQIISYFEDEYDSTEPKTEFEFEFAFNNQGEDFRAFVMFGVDEHGNYSHDDKLDIMVTDSEGLLYSIGDEEDNDLVIRNKNYNPNKKTVQQEITAIIEKEEQKTEERKRTQKDIEETNENLNR